MSDLAAALQVAIRVHAGQTDKQREPYLLHVLRVVEAVGDEAKVVAVLHDVVEDGHMAMKAVSAAAGLSVDEEFALNRLTRQGETYAEYIEGFARGYPVEAARIAREVKLADLRDNLGRIPPDPLPGYMGRDDHKLALRSIWAREWASLKARYEKAIATLEADPKVLAS